jgi:hypothetical protein
VYSIETLADVEKRLDALPHKALVSYAEALEMASLTPWNAPPWIKEHPRRPMRTQTFGDRGRDGGTGYVVFVILEDERRVVVVRVVWLD